jgi:glycerol-3-phosphate dehydrogenase
VRFVRRSNTNLKAKAYDAIVIGSGISGGCKKELTEKGLKF